MNIKQLRTLFSAGLTDEQIRAVLSVSIAQPEPQTSQKEETATEKTSDYGEVYRNLSREIAELRGLVQEKNVLHNEQPNKPEFDEEEFLANMLHMEV